ncbi:50S ribosomal protein L23 [Nymphaea thermarum]|nr:50S ribosomal protein L23 [Nymphaea thermarum]
MDGIKYAVFIEKGIWLLRNNLYTSNVESGSTKIGIKHWIELFFGVKMYNHYASTRLFYSTSYREKNLNKINKYLITWPYIYPKLLPLAQAKEL